MPEDLAAALGISAADIASLAADQGMWRTRLTSLTTLLACIDVHVAEQFRAGAGVLDSPETIPGWLAAHVSSTPRKR